MSYPKWMTGNEAFSTLIGVLRTHLFVGGFGLQRDVVAQFV